MKQPYSIFCILNGKIISSAWIDQPDDDAALKRAHWYFSASAAHTVRLHKGAPFYPLGELIAEIREAA
jgi:hypothetical protein